MTISDYLTQEEIDKEMDMLLEHYGAKAEQANLEKTRRILTRLRKEEVEKECQ